MARGRHRHPPVARPLRPGAGRGRAGRARRRAPPPRRGAGGRAAPSPPPSRRIPRPSRPPPATSPGRPRCSPPSSTRTWSPNSPRPTCRARPRATRTGGASSTGTSPTSPPPAARSRSWRRPLSAEARGPRSGAARLAAPPPRSTYRLQFHKDFTFADAGRVVPYLHRLGISHVYASPLQKARPGSTHGYDIVDHGAINPELGGEAGFIRLSETLHAHGIKLLLDIVPNHMGVGGADNPWWLSVLEWGSLSPFADAFDIDWQRLGAGRNLVIPFLGDRYGEALEKGTLELKFDPENGAFSVWHYEHQLPIRPLSYPTILNRVIAAIGAVDDDTTAELLAISERLRADVDRSPTRPAAEASPRRPRG
ncbi:alpha-amylase family glycosyl hydrolase [Methylobacterium oryzae CBMB20]